MSAQIDEGRAAPGSLTALMGSGSLLRSGEH